MVVCATLGRDSARACNVFGRALRLSAAWAKTRCDVHPRIGWLARDPQDDLAELLAALHTLVRGRGLREREYLVDDGPRLAGRDEVVNGLEVLARSHRRSVDGQLLPPEAVQVRRWIRARRRAAD